MTKTDLRIISLPQPRAFSLRVKHLGGFEWAHLADSIAEEFTAQTTIFTAVREVEMEQQLVAPEQLLQTPGTAARGCVVARKTDASARSGDGFSATSS